MKEIEFKNAGNAICRKLIFPSKTPFEIRSVSFDRVDTFVNVLSLDQFCAVNNGILRYLKLRLICAINAITTIIVSQCGTMCDHHGHSEKNISSSIDRKLAKHWRWFKQTKKKRTAKRNVLKSLYLHFLFAFRSDGKSPLCWLPNVYVTNET